MGLKEITVSQDIDIIDDHNEEWVDDRPSPRENSTTSKSSHMNKIRRNYVSWNG